LWPTITDQASAIEASKAGFWAAVVVATITAIFATVALVTQKEIASINAWAYVDAALFSIIAWRIKRYSKFFAVAGVVLFIGEKIMIAQTEGARGLPLAIILLLMFISGVRGVFGYHRYSTNEQQPAESV
jgi:hypothetical protein